MPTDRGERPLIGVSGPDSGGAAAWWATRLAVRRAGGRPRRITPARPFPADELDGLILGGGADVAPELYGQSLLETVGDPPGREGREPFGRRLFAGGLFLLRGLFGRKQRNARGDRERDELEEPLLAEALSARRPVLGICRGAQLINVHLGGTLHQDLGDFYEEMPDSASLRPRKLVEIAPGSLLESILDTGACRVNALHRQAIDRTGEGLEVVAREPNGVAQAVEAPDRDFLLGVQWHPEYLPWIRRQQRIFRRLVEASRTSGAAK